MSNYAIQVSQCVIGIDWRQLATIEIEDDATLEDALEAAAELTKTLGESVTMYFTTEKDGGVVICNRCGPVKFEVVEVESAERKPPPYLQEA